MSVSKTKKGFLIRFRPDKKLINLTVRVNSMAEARLVEAALLHGCRTSDFSQANPIVKAAAVKLYDNQGWDYPDTLSPNPKPKKQFTLLDGINAVYDDPAYKDYKSGDRFDSSLKIITDYFGEDTPLKNITKASLKKFMSFRQKTVQNPTINWDKTALSKVFKAAIDLDEIENNPCLNVKRLSVKGSRRDVYISFADVQRIAAQCPQWFQDAIWIAYYSGMRRGEVMNLTWNQIKGRIIHFHPTGDKEQDFKKVPIHRELLSIFDRLSKVRDISGNDRVIKVEGREVEKDTAKNPWPRALDKLNSPDPRPHYHDLRHCFITNAHNSRIPAVIIYRIVGHHEDGVHSRYVFVSDDELINGIDTLKVDFGPTVINVRKAM